MKLLNKEIDTVVGHKIGKQPPIPIKFRLNDRALEVDNVVSVKTDKRCGKTMFVYACQSDVNGYLKEYELRYEVESCKWFLYKI